MTAFSHTLATLAGLLLCVAGVTLALVSSLDLLWAPIGLALAAAGGVLLLRIQRHTPQRSPSAAGEGDRSRPKPLASDAATGHASRGRDRRI